MNNVAMLPLPEQAREARLGPLTTAKHPTRIGCVADTGEVALHHFRADTLEGVQDAFEIQAPGQSPRMRINGQAIYAGPYFPHFGHMAAEGIHRLWAASCLPELTTARVVFQKPVDQEVVLTGWLAELLALCGIEPGRVMFVDEQTSFEELLIPQQGRLLGGKLMLDGYVDLFPMIDLEGISRDAATRLYVSRARQHAGGSYLGEPFIETLLAAAGFEIVYPEEIGPLRMVARLRQAQVVVFAEGSAIHNLELAGRLAAKLLVIGRRFGTKRRFGEILASTTSEWRVVPTVATGLALERDAAGQPRRDRACGLVDLAHLVKTIAEFMCIDLTPPEPRAARQAIERDARRYLDRQPGRSISDADMQEVMRSLRTQLAS